MQITREKIIQELAAIGFARINHYMSIENGTIVYRDWDALPPDQQAAVAGAEQSSSGIKLKFYDKMKALELMGKIMGLFEEGAVFSTDDSLIQAILQATGKEVDTCDVPELQQTADAGPDLVEPAGSGGV